MSASKTIFFNLMLCLSVYYLHTYWEQVNDLKRLIELNWCPACYGTNICIEILSETIQIKGFDFRTTISNVINTKNVFYGINLLEPVVIKKLGNNKELNTLNEKMLNYLNAEDFYDMQYLRTEELMNNIKNMIELTVEPYSGLVMCPTADKFNVIIDSLANEQNIGQNLSQYKLFLMNIFTLLNINAEPIILQFLKWPNWPVAHQFGACGRVVVQKYMGKPLEYYKNAPWKCKANLVKQLLQAASTFTFKHEQFRFYLMDISFDNVVVDDIGNIAFVDLEHIIILDKYAKLEEKRSDWLTAHTSEVIDCEGQSCFAFSPQTICSHDLSDHNYYMICQMLFSNGDANFLYPIPKEVLEEVPNLPDLVQSCVDPSFGKKTNKPILSRIEWAEKVIVAMERAINILQ